jgi:hypothetical protein
VSARAELPAIRYDDGEFVATPDVPFSEALDKLIAEIRDGKAPNLGRFCGYCATPLTPAAERCPTCATETETLAPRDKIPRPLAAVYTRKRKVEARIIHSAAWLGITIGAAISIGLILVLPSWTKVFAVIFLIVGSFYIASYMGNVLAQNYAYRRGLRSFAARWQECQRALEAGEVTDDA